LAPANSTTQPLPFRGRGGEHIDLDEVGEGDQRAPRGSVAEIIEGDEMAQLLEAPAGRDGFAIELDIFKDFEDHAVFREQDRIKRNRSFPGRNETAVRCRNGLPGIENGLAREEFFQGSPSPSLFRQGCVVREGEDKLASAAPDA
jgi:hypothetical protein